MSDADLIAALLARLGGIADLSASELEAAGGLRLQMGANPVTGTVTLRLVER